MPIRDWLLHADHGLAPIWRSVTRVIGAVVDSVSDVLALGVDSIKPAPELNSSVDAGYIMGIGCVKSGDVERMLILTDIEALMSSAEMGLIDGERH